MTQTALPSMRQSDYEGMKIPHPSLPEQTRIVSFLDNKCGKIDEAIARQKAAIEKLDEYRKAVITKAVTRGVRGEREVKESGENWIPEIPVDWSIQPMKSVFRFGKGLSITKANLVDVGFPVISYGQIHAKYCKGTTVTYDLLRYVTKDYIDDSSAVYKNDFIFADTSEDLDGCGNCIYIDTDCPIYGGYHTIIARSLRSCDNKYLAYLFKTDIWRMQIRERLTEVKLFSISQKVLRDTKILIPSESEQSEIVAFLDAKCASIESMKTRHEEIIKKLEEYKKSLIFNAVTGKIEC